MVTTVGTESTLDELLNDLIKLDHDAAEAYLAAINRLENATYRSALDGFRQDHLRHVEELSEHLKGMGRKPPEGPDIKSVLTAGKVALASLVGDKAILQAMKTNEEDTNTAYERATKFQDAPPQVHATLERGREDERRHLDWIVETVDKL